jgi:archaellum component FlaD/FlaE
MKNLYENDELGHSENQLIDDGAREEGSASWDGEEEPIEDFSSEEEGIDDNQLEETPDSDNLPGQEEENAEDSFVEDEDVDEDDYEDSYEEESKNTLPDNSRRVLSYSDYISSINH